MRDLQATAGNRAVSDLVAGTGPVLQGSFFGGAFGGMEDWIAKQAVEGRSSFDPGVKDDPGSAAMKQEPSEGSQKFDGSEKWDGSEKFDASDKWDGAGKVDQPGWDGAAKADAPGWEGAAKTDSPGWVDASEKWDGSQKFDASDKWDASQKSEADLASKDDEFDQEPSVKW